MVFSFKSQQNSVLKKIQYVAKEDDIIKDSTNSCYHSKI